MCRICAVCRLGTERHHNEPKAGHLHINQTRREALCGSVAGSACSWFVSETPFVSDALASVNVRLTLKASVGHSWFTSPVDAYTGHIRIMVMTERSYLAQAFLLCLSHPEFLIHLLTYFS
jgi:hypothetical protein